MNSQGLKFRYLNSAACYEFVLPNGKTVIMDPFLGNLNDKEHGCGFTEDDFTACDYIIVSHTHGDHTGEIGYLVKKFNAKVIVGAMSALSLAKTYDLPTDLVYPVFPNEELEMEDFNIKVFRGKHTFSRKPVGINERPVNRMEPNEDAALAGIYGSMEYCDYVITTKENVRIYIMGGQPNWFYFTNSDEIARKYAPNIIIKQSSSKFTPEEYGRQMASYGAQLILPLHQDGLYRSPLDCTVDEWWERAIKAAAEFRPTAKVLNPVPLKWYTVSLNVVRED